MMKNRIDILCHAACLAGQEIDKIYHSANETQIQQKGDGSPLTQADLVAHHVIMKILSDNFPDIPIISEEGEIVALDSKRFFLIDPLDGTKEFISRNGDFTVNIALIENRKPIAGVIYTPAHQKLYWAEMDSGAGETGGFCREKNGERKTLQTARADKNAIRAVVSRSHKDAKTADFLTHYQIGQELSVGSSLKLCLLAEGKADLYPRFGRTMEWDIAAGHAILFASGGALTNTDGSAFFYQKLDYANDDGFIAYGDLAINVA